MSMQTNRVRLGRPPLAREVSRLPGVHVPVEVHDALIREARARDVSVAQIVRERLSGPQTPPAPKKL